MLVGARGGMGKWDGWYVLVVGGKGREGLGGYLLGRNLGL